MTDKQLRLELTKLEEQRQQWHDDFLQREKHWFWQRGFWLFMAGVALTTVFVKLPAMV